MKKIALILLAILLVSKAFSQNNSEKEKYYFYQGEKVYLEEDNTKILIKLSKKTNKSEVHNLLQNITNYKIQNSEKDFGEYLILETNKQLTLNEKLKSLTDYKNHTNIIYACFMLKYGNISQGYSNEFVVKLLPSTSRLQLDELCEKHKIITLKENQFDRNIFTIIISKNSSQNVIDLANIFHETGLFDYSEPNFIRVNNLHTSDPFFNDQWSIENTGQNNGVSGADMSVVDAWEITQGRPEIRIAVVDEGVDLVHPDLAGNLLTGFDATGNGSGGAPSGNESHGTACAGIIGAISDNNIGITGIAPNCRIMPARAQFGNVGTDGWLADCINWSWQNDADIISNSWGGGSPSNQITNAINNATNQGRMGLGSVVLFSTGNDDSSVGYPATLSNVIGVGAMSMCNERKNPNSCDGEDWWGSNFGSELDVVAPGVKIYTTDISGSAGNNSGDYWSDFNGTSSACPNTAGVMGLILSVNRCLTWQDAKTILELSCDKVGNYCYTNSSAHSNGTWNNQMGYGRVNALKAVQYAHSQNVTVSNNLGGSSDGSNGNIFQWILSSNSCSGEAAASYFVYRYEVYKDVTFPYSSSPSIITSSNGFSAANPNNGSFWSQAINITNTTARLRTFVYNVISSSGQSVGWIPNHPLDVKFNYYAVDNVTTNIWLQNETITSGTQTHNALNKILVGKNVTSSKPQGDYIVQGSANITLKAGNEIVFKPGTIISPSQGGSFHASIEPFFTCTQYPMGKMANSNSPNNSERNNYHELLIQNYDVSFEESGKVLLDEKTELKVYPNPSINNSTIEYFLPKESQVVISIIDAKGTQLVILKNRNTHKSGYYKINLELNNYPSGTYFVKMVTDKEVLNSQLIKQ
jgi:hypothetical protein